jgi:hypothetical protein
MKHPSIALLMAITATALLNVAVIRSTRLPGDVDVTGSLQSVAPEDDSWAEAITTTAKIPWNFILLAITFILSWLIAGWRAAALAAVCFAGLLSILIGLVWAALLVSLFQTHKPGARAR